VRNKLYNYIKGGVAVVTWHTFQI